MKSLDKVVFWSEYVIKHKGAHFLKSRSGDLPFYQYHHFDLLAIVIVLVSLAAYTFYSVIISVILRVKKYYNKKNV